jgi:GxxExxY protein
MDENQLGRIIVDSAIQVHKALGPGLLESAYEACLSYELRSRHIAIETQVGLPVTYGDVRLDIEYRIDILVEEKVIIEMKAVDKIIPIHEAQLLSYLKLSKCKLGFLLNFNVAKMKDGIHRMVNEL